MAHCSGKALFCIVQQAQASASMPADAPQRFYLDQTSLERFLERCQRLERLGVEFSVGVVAMRDGCVLLHIRSP
jgi:hypothetical protein